MNEDDRIRDYQARCERAGKVLDKANRAKIHADVVIYLGLGLTLIGIAGEVSYIHWTGVMLCLVSSVFSLIGIFWLKRFDRIMSGR